MYRVREQIGCTEAVTASCDGAPVAVAVLDTGIGSHPDFDDRIDVFVDFVHGRQWIYDDSGHGTHVAGCIGGSGRASEGRYRGMAPNCRLVVGKVLNENGDGNIEDMKRGIAWVIANRIRWRIRILNISIGIGYVEEPERMYELQRLVDQAWDCGLVVVCAAGNNGPGPMTISPLGASKKVITVGCHDGGYFGNKASLCENYSGRGPSPYAMKKPDIVCPGTDIISCSMECRKTYRGYRNAYVKKSGTSMATPIVSGAIALFLQKYPRAGNEEVKRKLSYTATDLHEPWSKQGWGMINAARFLD